MDYTFLGLQVAVKAFHKDPLRARLHAVIAKGGAEQTLTEKRQFWKSLTAVLNEAMPVFEYGFWDLLRNDRAEGEFETWCSEIEGSLATEAEELGREADEAYRFSADRKYVLVTLLFLLEQGSPSDVTVGERCDVPEADYFTRATLARIIATIPMLNFANVQGDAVYLMPGSDEDGLSDDDLHSGGYEYLKPLG